MFKYNLINGATVYSLKKNQNLIKQSKSYEQFNLKGVKLTKTRVAKSKFVLRIDSTSKAQDEQLKNLANRLALSL